MKRIIVFSLLSVTLLGAPLPEWRGYCSLDCGEMFSLSDPKTGTGVWVKEGQEFLGYRILTGSSTALVLAEVATGARHEVKLAASHIGTGRELPPLPRAEAISWVRRQLKAFTPDTLRPLRAEELSPKEKERLSALEKDTRARASEIAAVVEANSKARRPEPLGDIVEVMSSPPSDIIMERSNVGGVPLVVSFGRMTLDVLPAFVRTNITQEDLDALLAEQSAMMLQIHRAIEKRSR